MKGPSRDQTFVPAAVSLVLSLLCFVGYMVYQFKIMNSEQKESEQDQNAKKQIELGHVTLESYFSEDLEQVLRRDPN